MRLFEKGKVQNRTNKKKGNNNQKRDRTRVGTD